MILKLSLDLPDDGSYVSLIRQFGRGLLEYLNVVPSCIADVETIVSELVTNVIRHANSDKGRFQITLEYFAKKVIITVIDTGTGFTFRDVPEVGSPRPDMDGGERLGGFGLPLLDALSDRLNFARTDPHGTTVCAEKHLVYETQKDADDAAEKNQSHGSEVHLRAN